MRITSKGQVTIPIDIRERTGLLPGAEVEFSVANGDVVVRRSAGAPTRGEQLVAHLRGAGAHFNMTTDEIMALTRGED